MDPTHQIILPVAQLKFTCIYVPLMMVVHMYLTLTFLKDETFKFFWPVGSITYSDRKESLEFRIKSSKHSQQYKVKLPNRNDTKNNEKRELSYNKTNSITIYLQIITCEKSQQYINSMLSDVIAYMYVLQLYYHVIYIMYVIT